MWHSPARPRDIRARCCRRALGWHRSLPGMRAPADRYRSPRAGHLKVTHQVGVQQQAVIRLSRARVDVGLAAASECACRFRFLVIVHASF